MINFYFFATYLIECKNSVFPRTNLNIKGLFNSLFSRFSNRKEQFGLFSDAEPSENVS